MFMDRKKNNRSQIDPPKECVIRHSSGKLMAYDEENRVLYLSESFYVFPSKRKANDAMHHQVSLDKAAGKFEPWNDYEVIET